MLRFFNPASKVQKDRQIMRATDERMAKYSRRGLITNLLAFVVCLSFGSFFEENRDLAIILTIGLLLSTFLRGLLLFRFENLYPRAPAKWRNHYFIITLLGAIWWGVIMASITYATKMQGVAPLFWLYTLVFFSTTAYAFAPFNQFLSIYQFVGLIPGAIATLFLVDPIAYLYGALLIFFYLMLKHQCDSMSRNYWQKLEAQYTLARKETSLEVAKRDVKATQELSREFIAQLTKELSAQCPQDESKQVDVEALREISKIVTDFGDVLNKVVKVKECIFNIRHELQHIVTCNVEQAEQKGVDLEIVLSSALPMRVRGDSEKIAQVLSTLVELMLENMHGGSLVIEVEFLRQSETGGDLAISVTGALPQAKRVFFLDSHTQLEQRLDFFVIKGLAEAMNGSVEFVQSSKSAFQYRFSLPMELAHVHGQLDFHRGCFGGRKLLMVINNPRIQDIKRQQLDDLGFRVVAESSYKQAMSLLVESYEDQKPFTGVYYHVSSLDDEGVKFQREILQNKQVLHVNQFVCASSRVAEQIRKKLSEKELERIYFVNKPAGLFELELALGCLLSPEDEEGRVGKAKKGAKKEIIYYSRQDNFDSELARKLPEKTYAIRSAKKINNLISMAVEKEGAGVVVIDANSGFDMAEIVQSIRSAEVDAAVEVYIPILCVGNKIQDGETVSNIYQAGIDDYIDLSRERAEFSNIVANWFALASTE